MKIFRMNFVTVVGYLICLVAGGIVFAYFFEWNAVDEPSWLEAEYQKTPKWFRAIEDMIGDPEKFPDLMRVLDRGVYKEIRPAACLKANYIMSEQARTGAVETELLKQLPQLLAPYRLDQCPLKSVVLATVYKYGLGTDQNTALAEHYVRKIAAFNGHTGGRLKAWMEIILGSSEIYDISEEYLRAWTWIWKEFPKLDTEEQFKIAEAYFSGETVPKDLDLGYALLLAISYREHTRDTAYRAARGSLDRIMSYGEKWEIHPASSLLSEAARKGHPEARRDLGVELVVESEGHPEMLLHAYGYLLSARDVGAQGVEPLLSAIARRLDDAETEKKARGLISGHNLKPYWWHKRHR